MGKFQKTNEHKKQIKKYIQLGIGAAVVILLAIMPMLASKNQAAEDTGASILTATVENKSIGTQIIGGGQLSSAGSLNVRIPENVKLTQYLVGNGDTVLEGDPIAKVDKVSVMTAITEVQETLDYLAEEIADASDDTASTSVKALAGGTVKLIYAKEGESVQDVMLDHGALAVLSLDDTMAVKIERETSLDVGDTVVVTFSDGTEADGRVKNNLGGVLTVTIDDDDYAVGTKVTVYTEDADRLGTGELYILSPWSATAYSGTVSDILVDEDDSVYVGQSLLTLEDTGNTAQFQRLIDQRQEYEELMQELFTMYRTETITAPCDGIVTGVDEDGAYLLADEGKGWFVNLLSFFGKGNEDGFIAYAAQVAAVDDYGMTLLMNPKVSHIEDLRVLSQASADTAAMTKAWYYQGDTTIYTQNADGLLCNAGTAKAGDVLLAVGDEEQVHWFVVLDEGFETAQVTKTQNKTSGMFAFLLSDRDTTESLCKENEDCTADSHYEGCPKFPVQTEACTGNNSCKAESHDQECPMYPSNQIPSFFTAGGETVSITTTSLPDGKVGESYSATLEASGSGSWSVTELPAGLSLNSSTGEITGTPTVAGTFTVEVTFAYNEGETVTASIPLTIAAASSEDITIKITTETLKPGVVGQTYFYALEVSGSTGGTWTWAGNGGSLPDGLTLDGADGEIYGYPSTEGTFPVTVTYTYTDTTGQSVSVSKNLTMYIVTVDTTLYTGYVAQIVEIKDGWAKVKQTKYSYTITDLSNLPRVSVSTADLTEEKEYTSSHFQSDELAAGDLLLIVADNGGNVKKVSKDSVQTSQGTAAQGGAAGSTAGAGAATGTAGAAASGGSAAGGGGMAQSQAFETYSLDKLTVASVTSQEHMTVSITIDELDITKIYLGQAAIVSVDALGGEQFDAEVTRISNSGENSGGNSKFTVELTLAKSGQMLPGMYSSAFITLETSIDVPCVPVAALGKRGVDSILYTSYNAEKGTLGDPVTVTIGASDGENVEIVDGFTAGQTCYYEYYDTYTGSDTQQQQRSGFNLGRMLGGR